MTLMTRVDAALAATKPALTGLTADAHVRTPCGERRVEFLRPGDLIVTRSDGLQPLRHILRDRISLAELRADPALAPIRITPRALGPMMPARSLSLAPEHPIRVPAHLLTREARDPTLRMTARSLADHFADVFVDMSGGDVTYHRLIFDTAQMLLVNGVLVESFAPDKTSLHQFDDSTRAEIERIFPDLRSKPPRLAL